MDVERATLTKEQSGSRQPMQTRVEHLVEDFADALGIAHRFSAVVELEIPSGHQVVIAAKSAGRSRVPSKCLNTTRSKPLSSTPRCIKLVIGKSSWAWRRASRLATGRSLTFAAIRSARRCNCTRFDWNHSRRVSAIWPGPFLSRSISRAGGKREATAFHKLFTDIASGHACSRQTSVVFSNGRFVGGPCVPAAQR